MKPGTKVQFINDIGGGVVIRTEENRLLVEDELGFERWVYSNEVFAPRHDLEKAVRRMDETRSESMKDLAVKKPASSKSAAHNKTTDDRSHRGHLVSRENNELLEIDLHAHVLFPEDPEPSRVLKLQLEHLERMLKHAMNEKINRLIIIHGKGGGILRHEVRKLLRFYPQLTAEDASFDNYGMGGATLVRIYYQ